MIKILVNKNSEGNITKISATGHANYAKHGQDIVCAAVSILFQSTLNGLTEIVKAEADYEISEAYMLIKPKITDDKKELINALLDTLELALDDIVRQYPKYLNITKGGASNDKN